MNMNDTISNILIAIPIYLSYKEKYYDLTTFVSISHSL